MSTILKVDDINVYYGSIHAIKGISFEVNQGEIVTLIGANGAGKSTTLNTISGLLHSKTGAAIARDVFGVEDAVYDAIWYHTTGKPDMTLLEKIIYLADYIEPSRDFDGVDTLRQAVYEDLDHGLLMGLSMTIQEMEEMGNPVHHLTRDARDYLLKRGIR